MIMTPITKKKLCMITNQWIKSALSILPKTISDLVKSIVLFVISFFLTYVFWGGAKAIESIPSGIINIGSLLTLLFAYIILHVFITSPFKGYQNYKKLGFWDGTEFHYHSEILVYTGVIHPEGQKLVTIKFPKECKDTLVSTHTITSGAYERVKAGFSVMQTYDGRWHIPMSNGNSRTSIRLYKREQSLITESLPGTVPIRVKVYLESWAL